ncbi:hypothetical protein BCY91_09270 [Pelobium manganitolerans]|uniref:Uncharacterized protein n=1 Tax=Pelobium manganitolerans TaxID=1842495 RepID=A0A419S395_9SPHI|nr:hypothetical protein [Pelobium manganitolerans]RKD13747.1 hypothetical protein BCY91_09270 [Pelobium manganitolerans]
MKKLIKPLVLLFALVTTGNLSFANGKVPEVYISEAPVSDLSGQQLLNTTWFWLLVAVVLVVLLTALVATKDQENQTHFPEHLI